MEAQARTHVGCFADSHRRGVDRCRQTSSPSPRLLSAQGCRSSSHEAARAAMVSDQPEIAVRAGIGARTAAPSCSRYVHGISPPRKALPHKSAARLSWSSESKMRCGRSLGTATRKRTRAVVAIAKRVGHRPNGDTLPACTPELPVGKQHVTRPSRLGISRMSVPQDLLPIASRKPGRCGFRRPVARCWQAIRSLTPSGGPDA
jgi:hypothetical protein